MTITADAGTIDGTLSIALYKDSCDPAVGTLEYTEPVPNSGAFTATAAGATYDTTNGSDSQTEFKVSAAGPDDYF